jgi:hypothetical protein
MNVSFNSTLVDYSGSFACLPGVNITTTSIVEGFYKPALTGSIELKVPIGTAGDLIYSTVTVPISKVRESKG